MTSIETAIPQDLKAELRRLGGLADDEIDLGEAALTLAALDLPRAMPERYRHHLSLLARDTAALAARLGAEDDLQARAEALCQILVGRYGYEGDGNTYDDLQNANLMRVIDRRKGLPVALGILFLQTARAQGWMAAAINFPGHFLIRLELHGERLLLDPFHQGRLCDTRDLRELLKFALGPEVELGPEHYAEIENRQVLLRLQNNIKVRLLQSEDLERAVAVIEAMLMFAPSTPSLWCDLGLAQARLGSLRAAIVAFDNYLQLGGQDPRRHEVVELLQQLRHKLN